MTERSLNSVLIKKKYRINITYVIVQINKTNEQKK